MLLRMMCNLKLKLLISGTYHLIFLECGGLQVTETEESEITEKWLLLHNALELESRNSCLKWRKGESSGVTLLYKTGCKGLLR